MSQKAKNSRAASILCLAAMLLLAGCAVHPWSKSFKDSQVKAYKTMVEGQIKNEAACSSTLDAEATVTWKTSLGTKAFSGYLQLQPPSSLKFVAANPFGQTLFALVSDGTSFSSVNTITGEFISGSLTALALRNNIPEGLLNGDWGTWLSGRILDSGNEKVVDIRKDASGRGLWIVAANKKNRFIGKEYILIDSQHRRPLLRVLQDVTGETIARIKYGDWHLQGRCNQPLSFAISDLPMGAEITLDLSDILVGKTFGKNNFRLSPPPGYSIKALP